VPSAEKKMLGGGEMVESCEGHCSLSLETRGWSLGSLLGGWRRAMAWMLEMVGREMRVERMCEPCCDACQLFAVCSCCVPISALYNPGREASSSTEHGNAYNEAGTTNDSSRGHFVGLLDEVTIQRWFWISPNSK
jgi:hypothetical protein